MTIAWIFVPLFLIAAYLLYDNGLLVFNSKRAMLYVGSLHGRKAKFASCTGQTKRIVRFKESRSYQFLFDCELTSGEVSVELFDRSKQKILSLSRGQQRVTVALERGKRYVLVFHFQNATGNYLLDWT